MSSWEELIESHHNICGQIQQMKEEAHTITVERELVNIKDGNKAPDHCDYCGSYWPCPFAVGKELL